MTAMITPASATTTTTTVNGKTPVMPALAKSTTISSIPVRAIPVPNTNKLILAGPCIVLRTATVAEQVQALRQEKKALTTTSTTATSTSTVNIIKSEPKTPELLRCKRRTDLGKLGFPEAKPVSVSRRNARERNRVKLVNQGFDTLREHVPNGKKNRKMSKVDTLRSAVDYIRQLQELIDQHDEQMETSSSETSPADVTLTTNSPDDDVFQDSLNSSSESLVSSAKGVTMDIEGDVSDSLTNDVLNNNNNNNNKFVNFNVDNGNVGERVDMNTVGQGNSSQVNSSQVNSSQVNSLHMNTLQQQVNAAVQANNLVHINNVQSVNNAQSNTVQSESSLQHLQNLNATQLLNTLNSLNASTFINTSSLTSSTPSSTSPTTTTTSTQPPTITVITLPIQPQPTSTLPTIATSTTTMSTTTSPNDDVFLPEVRPRIRTSTSSSPTSLTTGTLATLTTLQGMGSLSGQGLTITQPCRRHLSFSEPEPERPVQIQPRLSLSDLNDRSNNQQQHINFTLVPGQQHVTDFVSNNNNSNTVTLVQQPIVNQQQQDQQHFNTLSNFSLANQSVNAAFSLDQSASSLPMTDNQSYQFQTAVAPGNMAMKQQQLLMDQVPSPSLSTSSSQMSESSYDSYDSLGSLEEDLQDISNWITELCAQDINGDGDDGVNFLAYDNNDDIPV